MEVSPNELMNILNKIVTKREWCVCVYLYYDVCSICFMMPMLIVSALCVNVDGNLKTDGFSIESCRSMVAVMDVSCLF